MEHGGYVLGGFSGDLGCWLVCTEADPVDIPFELETEPDSLDFGVVKIDTTVNQDMRIVNIGRRYAVIDSLWSEGDSAFVCPLEFPFRIEPEDTASIPITFQPMSDTTYSATLFFLYGNDQTIDLTLSGQGRRLDIVHSDEENVPHEFELIDVNPNPFNSTVTIKFDIPERGDVRLVVYDLSGREVATLLNTPMKQGQHIAVWDASNLPSGVYMCRLSVGNSVATRKLVLLR